MKPVDKFSAAADAILGVDRLISNSRDHDFVLKQLDAKFGEDVTEVVDALLALGSKESILGWIWNRQNGPAGHLFSRPMAVLQTPEFVAFMRQPAFMKMGVASRLGEAKTVVRRLLE